MNTRSARPMKARFARRLKLLRKAHHLSQKVLGARAGIDWKLIQRYERAAHLPRRSNQELLAEALHVTPEQLLGEQPLPAALPALNRKPSVCGTMPRAAALERPELQPLVAWMDQHDVEVVTIVAAGPELGMLVVHGERGDPRLLTL